VSETFDPYYRWLGIPPKDHPPHHYRLLGIELFEPDQAVIENSADRQMAHLRTFQSGPNAASSQKLLNEVAAAKVCLLNPEKKAAYDAALRQQLAAKAAEVILPLPPPPSIPPRDRTKGEKLVRKKPPLGLLLATGLSMTALVAVLAWKILATNSDAGRSTVAVSSGEDGPAAIPQDGNKSNVGQEHGNNDGRPTPVTPPPKVRWKTKPPEVVNQKPPGPEKPEETKWEVPPVAPAGRQDAALPPRPNPQWQDPPPADPPATAEAEKERLDQLRTPLADELGRMKLVAQRREFYDRMVELADEALAENDLGRHVVAAGMAEQVAAMLKDEGLLASARQLRASGDAAQAAFKAAVQATDELQSNREAPAPLSAIGTYLCFYKDDWEKGLPYLAWGSDPQVKEIALNDYRQPEEAEAQAQLADSWWDWAQRQPSAIRMAALDRAGYWYREAIPELEGARAEQARLRLTQLAVAKDPSKGESEGDGGKDPKAKTPRASTMEVRVSAPIDGRDQLTLDRKQAVWSHHDGRWPPSVTINGGRWSPNGKSTRPYDRQAQARFRNADFQSAEIVERRGRGKIELVKSNDQLVVIFDDNEKPGSDMYYVRIRMKRAGP
jgi:hypothetical protein